MLPAPRKPPWETTTAVSDMPPMLIIDGMLPLPIEPPDPLLPVDPKLPEAPMPEPVVSMLPVAPTPPTLPLAVRVDPESVRVVEVEPVDPADPEDRLRRPLASCGLAVEPRTTSFTSPMRLPLWS